ncbi:MAG: methyltransferase domain-containing protein [Balneolaceae bacterium]
MGKGMYESGGYLELNPTWHVEDSPWKAARILDMINRNDLKPGTVCEVGCGAGEILVRLGEKMPGETAFTGYEISPQAFALCKKQKSDRVTFHLKDLLKEEDASFDLLLAIDLFEHVEDYMGFLRKLRSRGTYTIFHIPLDLSVQMVLRGEPLLKVRRKVGHLHYFTRETALAALKDTGYEILDSFYTAGSIELPGRSLKARLARGPRQVMFALNQHWTVRILGGYSLMVLAK